MKLVLSNYSSSDGDDGDDGDGKWNRSAIGPIIGPIGHQFAKEPGLGSTHNPRIYSS